MTGSSGASWLRALALVALMSLLAGACGDDDTAEPVEPTATAAPDPTDAPDPTPEPTPTDAPAPTAEPTPTLEPTPTTAPEPTHTAAPVPDAFTVNVYWAWSIPSVASGTPERLGAGGRQGDAATPARSAMVALLAGPNAVEAEIGMSNSIPAETELLDLDIDEGVATVDLSAAFEASSGSLDEFVRVGQVVFTLTQFDSVDLVRFRIDGVDREALASHGIDVSGGVDRDDFVGVRPAILVERPYPGALVGDEVRITGESNTFEANVQWTVVDGEGLIIAEGFTTATAGNGTWGRFDLTVAVPEGLTGRGGVIVFDTSAQDGSQTDIVEYPIEF